jgi:hypothetical protein
VGPGIQALTLSGGPLATIDNQSRSYQVRFEPGVVSSNHRIAGVRVAVLAPALPVRLLLPYAQRS